MPYKGNRLLPAERKGLHIFHFEGAFIQIVHHPGEQSDHLTFDPGQPARFADLTGPVEQDDELLLAGIDLLRLSARGWEQCRFDH
jgi:hypothetical protein